MHVRGKCLHVLQVFSCVYLAILHELTKHRGANLSPFGEICCFGSQMGHLCDSCKSAIKKKNLLGRGYVFSYVVAAVLLCPAIHT